MLSSADIARVEELRSEYFGGMTHERYVIAQQELQALLDKALDD